jgi:hypothetical protein
VFDLLGGRTRARTWDPLIKSQLLYQLSYAPGPGPERAFRETASFSKATLECLASARAFHKPRSVAQVAEKPPESGGLPDNLRNRS